jgi:uncharacterized protein
MRIFLDANILFSGARRESRMRAFLEILFDKFECLTNAYAVDEARRNLELKDAAQVSNLTTLVDQCTIVGSIVVELSVTLEPKDIPILGGAMAGKATHLLTGDARHFGIHFGKIIDGVKVVSPRILADELASHGII